MTNGGKWFSFHFFFQDSRRKVFCSIVVTIWTTIMLIHDFHYMPSLHCRLNDIKCNVTQNFLCEYRLWGEKTRRHRTFRGEKIHISPFAIFSRNLRRFLPWAKRKITAGGRKGDWRSVPDFRAAQSRWDACSEEQFLFTFTREKPISHTSGKGENVEGKKIGGNIFFFTFFSRNTQGKLKKSQFCNP